MNPRFRLLWFVMNCRMIWRFRSWNGCAGCLLFFLLPKDGDEAVLWNNYELHQRLAKEAPQALYNVVQLLPLSACEMCWMLWQPWNTHSSFFELWSRHTFRLRPLIKLCSTSVSESMWLVLQESTVRELQKLLYSDVVCTCRKPGSLWHIAQVGKSFSWLWPYHAVSILARWSLQEPYNEWTANATRTVLLALEADLPSHARTNL